jgi:hypothetical protein
MAGEKSWFVSGHGLEPSLSSRGERSELVPQVLQIK